MRRRAIIALALLAVAAPSAALANHNGKSTAASERAFQHGRHAVGQSGKTPAAARKAASQSKRLVAGAGDVAPCLQNVPGWRPATPTEISTIEEVKMMKLGSCTSGMGLDWSGRAAFSGNAVLARIVEEQALTLDGIVGVLVRPDGEAVIVIPE